MQEYAHLCLTAGRRKGGSYSSVRETHSMCFLCLSVSFAVPARVAAGQIRVVQRVLHGLHIRPVLVGST
ncbi:hypothetical protein NXS19_001345 [Fusarium pseudograminearum]|nr:hypothetical protein NXS19_001345 [Fusarium pseudograminearum]